VQTHPRGPVICDDASIAIERECVFCGICAGQVPASVVVADDRVLTFMDVDPVTPGHVRVVPREHHVGLTDLPAAIGAEMFAMAQRISTAIRSVAAERADVRCEGINLFLADGAAASQEVFHAHLHVFPRFADDGFVLRGAWGSAPERAVLDAQARAISGVLLS
jgi:histidine triad (HIT) family protein